MAAGTFITALALPPKQDRPTIGTLETSRPPNMKDIINAVLFGLEHLLELHLIERVIHIVNILLYGRRMDTPLKVNLLDLKFKNPALEGRVFKLLRNPKILLLYKGKNFFIIYFDKVTPYCKSPHPIGQIDLLPTHIFGVIVNCPNATAAHTINMEINGR